MNPRSPACCKVEHETGSCPGIVRTVSGSVIRESFAPQTLHNGKPGLGGTGCETGLWVVAPAVGVPVVTGDCDGSCVDGADGCIVDGVGALEIGGGAVNWHPQFEVKGTTIGQNCGSIKPKSPASSNVSQVMGSCPGTMTSPSGIVTRPFSPQTLHAGNPGLGGTG